MGAASRLALALACFGLGAMPAHAVDGMWLAAPSSNDFNTGTNWTSSPSVPTGIASFGASTQTSLTFSSLATTVGTLQFNLAAPSYTFTLVEQCTPSCVTQTLTLNGTGIVNNAAVAPTLKTTFFAGLAFQNNSTAANAKIVVQEGFLDFNNTSKAGSATITMPDSLHAGFITFHNSSSAQNATITTTETQGAQTTAELVFLDKSTAGNATINNNTGISLGPGTINGGRTEFGILNGTDTADAGSAHITNNQDGSTSFFAHTSAMNATFVNNGTGHTDFRDQSTAANAIITNNAGGEVFVAEQATLGNATITNNNGFVDFGFAGLFPIIIDTATAGNATIINNGGTVTFNSATTGGNATITNNAGFVFFNDVSTAGSATIVNAGSVSFLNSSSAGNAGITTNAGNFLLSFADQSSAGNATITTNSGSMVQFTSQASGGNARFITNAGGIFDISGLTTSGTTAGSIEGAGTYFLGSKELTVGSNNMNTVVDGVISDGGQSGGTGASLVKVGTGTLVLSGTNTYSGGTTIDDGVLQLGNGGTTGSVLGNITDNSVLAVNRSDAFVLGNLISGAGSFQQLGTGVTIMTADNSYSGGTTISAGTLQLGNGGTTGSVVGNITDNSALAVNHSGTFVLGNLISGTGSFQQLGTGVTVMTADNSYSGGTTITAGTLQLGNGGTTGSIVGNVTDNAILAVNRSNTLTLNGVISGTGSLQQLGTGTTILTGNNTYSGGTTISAGTLQLGNGGTSGAIVGNVTDNAVLAVNRSDALTLTGVISGTGAFQQLGTGTTILTGNDTYSGGTTITAGTLQLGNGGTSGSVVGNITDNSVLAVNRSDAFTLSNLISGTGSFKQLGTGTTILTGNNTYSGGTTISAGTLQLGNGGTTGSVLGNITDNAVLAVNRSDAFTLSNLISGTGAFQQLGTGTTILTGNNSYSGGTTITAGTLQLGNGGTTGSILGNITDNSVLAVNRSDTFTLNNVISGTGSFQQLGTGITVLTAANTYTGPTLVNAGILDVNGSLLSVVTVNSGGELMGNGSIKGLVVNGGTVAPGNSIGTLTVNGNVTFGSGSVYQVEANAAGQADKINASGSAVISGGTVQVLAQMGNYALTTKYTILTASSGVTGTFSGVTSNMPFLNATLSYDPDDVFLTLTRASMFQSIAQTPNQRAVAAALDQGPITSPLVQAVLFQSNIGALRAFDALSGEIYATAQTTMLDDQRYAREAVLGRLRQAAFGGAGPLAALGTGGPVLAYAEPTDTALGYAGAGKPAFPVKAPPAAPAATPEITWWAQGVGAWGHIDGDGNAADAKRNLAAAFTGVDRRLGDNWRVGFVGGYTDSSLSVSARGSAANIETAYLGAYAGATYGPWSLRSGAIAGFSTTAANRTIAFPGFIETASSRYDGGAAQVFGEVGYGVALGAIAVEPFAGAAFVHIETDGTTETGGIAALNGAGARDDVGYTTLGARAATTWTLGNGMWLTPRASAAWQHAFGDLTPVDTLAFQSTGAGFTVAGVPLARDAALVEGALDLHVTPAATLGISYVGQLAQSAQDHSVKGNFSWKF